jgi:hypothetical protein
MNSSTRKTPGLSQRTLRCSSGLLCAAGLWAAAGVAQAETRRPTLSEMPIASLPRQESIKVPEGIRETSEALPFEIVYPQGHPAAEQAKKRAKKVVSASGEYEHLLTLRARSNDLCLRSNGASVERNEDRDRLHFHGYSGYGDQIFAVRAERLTLEKGPALVVDDYFVAPRAGIVEHGSTTELPLVKVGEVAGGLSVYAYREPHQLNLVLSAPGGSMIGPNARAQALGCGVTRVSLDTTGRSGVATSFAIGLPDRDRPEDVEDFRAYNQVPMDRALRVSVSVSQTSRDPAPVLSLTFGKPSRPVSDALKNLMPRWSELLGTDKANELEQQLAKRE